MWQEYINASHVDQVLKTLADRQGKARVVAGATDLILELENGVRKDVNSLIDISRIPQLNQIILDEDGVIHLGPLVTHNHCVSSRLIVEQAFPLAQAAWGVGSPQIRNRGTIAGNLITASPANDAITPLMALNANVTLRSMKGERKIPLSDFYKGVRKTVMDSDEMLVDIAFSAMKPNQRGVFIKHALRRAQAISVVNAAIILTLNGSAIEGAAITLGSVAPTIIHAENAEAYLVGKAMGDAVFQRAAELTMDAAKPISDVRGSAAYRRAIVKVITERGLKAIAEGNEKEKYPASPVYLWGPDFQQPVCPNSNGHTNAFDHPIDTTVNGKKYSLNSGHHKTLLRLIREDIGLTGSKEGCAEGECGACTVYLDGAAVMSCLVPAPRAHGAEIVTIEGLAQGDVLHPVQQTFIEEGAAQCGYCTPGIIMSGAKLLEERAHPSTEEVKQAITGNLCRCTGYYKIIQAIEKAAEMSN